MSLIQQWIPLRADAKNSQPSFDNSKHNMITRQVYKAGYFSRQYPDRKNLLLGVHAELPPGRQMFWDNFESKLKTAFVAGKSYHWCDRCNGWIEGEAQEYEVNSLRPLSGRRGKEYNCRRCGEEIVFVGAVS